jgi:hypothetical protein
MAEKQTKWNGNGNGSRAESTDRSPLIDGTSPMSFRRIVVATHDLMTDECVVTLIVDGEQTLSVPAADWVSAQQDAARLLTAGENDGNGGAHAS